MRFPALLLLAAFGAHAWAFAPTGSEGVHIGSEPSRVMRFHSPVQHELLRAMPWQDFLAGEGQGWLARFDERTGLPYRAWGPGIALAGNTASELETSLRALITRHPHLFGVSSQELLLRDAGYIARTDTWYLQLDQVVNGVPLWRGGVTARVRGGELLLFGANTYPQARGLDTVPALSAETAVEQAIELGPEPFVQHTNARASLVILPLELGGKLDYRLTWEVRTRTAEPPGIWVTHIDAHTGDLLNVYNEVRFFTGEVYAQHDLRTVDGNTTTSALPLAAVTNSSGASAYTDRSGQFILDESGSFTVSLNGDYVRVRDSDRSVASASFTGSSYTLDTDDATLAEIDSYVFLHQIQTWGLTYAPEVSWVTDGLTSNVNGRGSCNAYFDGDVNFYEADEYCNNTGRIADVNHHEWGHGLHAYSLESGSYDGSMGEGISDVVAFLQTGDATIGPYFFLNGRGVRDLTDHRTYPDDVTGEVHDDGMIFGGAVWDLYELLSAETDPETAADTISKLLVEAIKAGPTLTTAYDEFALADDDDGDISNGSPNQCALLEAFGAHGLGPGSTIGELASLDHAALDNQLPDTSSYPVSADLYNLAPGCVSVDLNAARVWYSTDAGETWDSTALSDTDSDTVEGSIPQQDPGTVVQYYIEVDLEDGGSVTAPAGGVINPHTFIVGEKVEIYCEDFEASDGGYTHELISGPNQEGADDWMHAAPTGLADDPTGAFSGRYAWGNDLGGGRYNGEYQPGVHNRLSSPAISVEGDHQALVLQFRRWLNVEDGHYDEARVLVDGEVAWTNYATSRDEGDFHTKDQTWALHSQLITDADGDGLVTLSWEIESDDGLEMGGWTIDDVCVYGLVFEENPNPGDSDEPTGDSDEGGVIDDTASGSQIEIKPATCGCSSSPSPGAGLGLLGLLGLLLRRRRG